MKRHPGGTRRLKVRRLIIGLIVILALCFLVPVFQASSATEPVTIDTTEVSNVTQFNNQRKLVRLSDEDGTLYAVYEKQLQVLVDSGTATGGSNTTLQDTTKSWPAEEFVHDRVEFTIDTIPYNRIVTSNTATELTFAALPPGVTVLDLALNIDNTPITLAYGDDAAAIAEKIASAAYTNVTAEVVADFPDQVKFTAKVAPGDGPVPMADAEYSGGTVPDINLAGGGVGVKATATITIPAGVPEDISYEIWRFKTQVYIKESADNGQTWTDETRISTYSGMADYGQRYPSIAVDSNDYLHVVWSGCATGYTTFGQLWYAKYTTMGWSDPVRISTYPGMETWSAQSGASIAVDSSDYLHVVWYGCATGYTLNQQIWYNKYTTSWAGPVRISTCSGMENYQEAFPSIAVDSENNLHVVWYGYAREYRLYKQIWYAKYTEESWAEPVRISTQNTHQRAPSIAVDSFNYLHVVWFGYVGDYAQIWYAKYTESWAGPVRISTYSGMGSYHQYEPSIAVDSKDNLHVVWDGMATGYTDYHKVWYAKYITSWATPECLQPTGSNRASNARWSQHPSSNIPDAGVDYVFTEGLGFIEDSLIPVNIYWDKKDNPFPP